MATSDNGTAIVPRNQLEAILREPARRIEIENAMPFDDPKTVRHAMQQLIDFARNQDGLLARATDKSKFDCVLGAARLGLQLNSPLHHCAAVPFKTKNGVIATLIIEYRGLLSLMRRYGGVKEVHTGLIHDNDAYEWTESDFRMSRVIGDRGEPIGAYAKLVMQDGSNQCEVMTIQELEHVRAKSRAKSDGPWVTDTHQMYRKTVLRRAANLVDLGPKGAELLQQVDRTEFRFEDAEVEVKEPSSKRGSKAVWDAVQPKDPAVVGVVEPLDTSRDHAEEPEEALGPGEEIDPETGEILPPELGKEVAKEPPGKPRARTASRSEADALHLARAQALTKRLGLPTWQKLTDARRSLLKRRMTAEGMTEPGELWDAAERILGGLTASYWDSWAEQATLDVLLRVPQRGNPDHWTKLAEGPARVGASDEPPSSTLLDLLGGGE